MTAFTPVVQADFSGTGIGSAPTWVDITRFARLQASPTRITRWRADEQSQVAPSNLSISLDNADLPGDATAPNAGRFTPGNSSSPWASGLIAAFRIRIGVTISATTYWLFSGFIDPIEAGWDGGDFPVVTATAQDWLTYAGNAPLRSMLTETVLLDSPALYLPLTDATNPTAPAMLTAPAGSVASIKQSKYGGGAYSFTGAGPTAEGSSNALVLTQTSTTQGYIVNVEARGPSATSGSLRINWAGTATTGTLIRSWDGFGQFITIDLDGAGHAKAATNAGVSVVSVAAINDGQPHDIVATFTGAAISITVDGVVATSAVASYPSAYFPVRLEIGGQLARGVANLTSGTYSHAAFFTGSAPNAANHYTAGRTGFAGETTSAHITRLLGFRPDDGSSLATGQATIGLHQVAGVTLQQALMDTAKAEGGLLYVDGAGVVKFINRTALRNPVVAATLDITAQQVDPDLTYRLDTQNVKNDVSIGRPNGATQRVQDVTSQNTPLGVRSSSDTLILSSDLDALAAAGWTLANQKTPLPRAPALTHDALSEPTASVTTSLLNLVPLQRVSLINPAPGAPAIDMIVQGSTIVLGVDVFTISFNTSRLPRPTLRFDAAADAFTKLDAGNVFAW